MCVPPRRALRDVVAIKRAGSVTLVPNIGLYLHTICALLRADSLGVMNVTMI
jgi:hypothetical protein